ncbi:hypothetical protein AMTR_s00034p00242270, partial [Amborella trichopoda]
MNSDCHLLPCVSLDPPNLRWRGGVSDKEPREHKHHLLQLRVGPCVLAHLCDSHTSGHSGELSPDISQLIYHK